MVTLFTMHLLGAIPNAGKYLEFSIEGPDYYPWQDGLFVHSPYTVVDGKVTIPSEPGWGVEIDPAWLAQRHLPEERGRVTQHCAPALRAERRKAVWRFGSEWPFRGDHVLPTLQHQRPSPVRAAAIQGG